MTVRNLSPATQQSYIYAVAKFSRHFARSPDRLGPEDVRTYQLHLIAQQRSWSHINQIVSALRFFYGVTLGRPDANQLIVAAREPQRLPVVLSGDEVVRFLEAVPGLRNRVALTTAYGPRSVGRPSKLAAYLDFLRERMTAFPDLSATRLTREIRELGYAGAYTAVKRYLAAIRPQKGPKPYEVRFETPPGVQARVDFARFVVDFADDPGTSRIVWLFSLVLGHSRFIFARFVLHQDLQTLLRCHIQAFAALGGVPIEILYDRMKTAVTGEDDAGHIVYNPSLLALARHYRFQPRACRPYRAKTKGKVERPFSYIRQDFFLGRSFRNLDDLNSQLTNWLDTVANVRTHGTTQRVVAEAFAAEQPELQTLPQHCFGAVLKLERRVSHDGFVAVGGNYYSVPDRTRRVVEVQQLPDLIRILDLGNVVAEHPVLEGRKQYRSDRSHRTGGSGARPRTGIAAGVTIGRIGDHVPLRSLAVYDAIGGQLATGGRP